MVDENKLAAMISQGAQNISDNNFHRETAARVLAGLASRIANADPESMARIAVKHADALIAELAKET